MSPRTKISSLLRKSCDHSTFIVAAIGVGLSLLLFFELRTNAWSQAHQHNVPWLVLLLSLSAAALLTFFVQLTLSKRKEKERQLHEHAAYLKEIERKYRSLFEDAPIGLSRARIFDGLILDCNDRFAHILGYDSRAELLSSHFSIQSVYVQPEKRAEFLSGFAARKVFDFEVDLYHRAGHIITLLVTATMFPEEDFLEAVVLDITSRKQMERELERYKDKLVKMVIQRTADLTESERRYYEIFNASECILMHDAQTGQILDANIPAQQMYGYSKEELLQLTVGDISSKANEFTNEKALELIRTTFEKGPQTFEWQGRNRAGEITWKEVSLRPSQIVGQDCVLAFVRDISRRKKMEEELKTERAQLLSIFDSITEAVYVADMDTYEMLFANKMVRDVFGQEIIGQKCYRYLQGLDAPCEFCTNLIIKNLNNQPYFWDHFNANVNLHYQIIDRVIRWTDGRNVRFELAFDITQRKRAEAETQHLLEELSRKNKELESIVYVASHDLRAPLINLHGFTDRLEHDCQELLQQLRLLREKPEIHSELLPLIEKRLPRTLHFIRASGGKMETLINGLLQISRVGRTVLKPELLEMNQLIDQVVAAQKFQLEKHETKLDISVLPNCWGDANQVNQVFSNLIDNAIKYRAPERTLHLKISGEIKDHEILYTVTDNGQGIAAEYHEKIWELFHRLEPHHHIEGQGIGLTLVRLIVERHGGYVGVKSTPGEGSIFTVALPRFKPLFTAPHHQLD